MLLKEAPWEKRNMGVTASVFYIDIKDTTSKVLPYIGSCTAEYQEMRIPAGNTEILLMAQDHGFKVIEMGIRLHRSLENVELPGIYKRFLPHISYAIADDISQILDTVKSGDMFLTDKIARNPRFGLQAAGRRYAYWLQDARENGALFVLSVYKEQTIGFYSTTHLSNNIYDGILGGVFPAFAGKGLGFIPPLAGLLALKDLGAVKVIGHVSSNNIPILKFHEILGFTVENMEYVLIKDLP